MKKVMLGGKQVTFRTKISKSKQELARIISENGGWRDGAEWAAQDSSWDDYPLRVCLYMNKPKISKGDTRWIDEKFKPIVGDGIEAEKQIPNWHQTILSRAEYFHLYPAPDAEVKVMVKVENHTTCHLTLTDGPTIEQLADDYRNAKDYAERKQLDADAARADAGAKLKELELAGEALGLLVKPITELMITELRDLRVGDEVEASYRDIERITGKVIKIDIVDKNQPICVSDGIKFVWATDWKFIRRP